MRMTLTQFPLVTRCQRMRPESLHMRRPQHCQLYPPSPPFFYLCSPAQFAFLALFALSQWTWSHLTHSVCLLNLQQHWQHTSTEAAGTLWPRGEGQQHQRQLRLRFLLLNAKNTKTPRRNMLHCIDCRKRDMPAPHPHPHHHIDPSARLPCPATPPCRVTHNLLPLERGLISVFPWLLPRQGSLITGCLWQLDSVYLYPVISRGAQAN